MLRAHLVNLVTATGLLPGLAEQAFIDVDSLLRPTFGHAKQGANYGHIKLAGKQVLRKGLSPLAATISTRTGAPVIAGIRSWQVPARHSPGSQRSACGLPGAPMSAPAGSGSCGRRVRSSTALVVERDASEVWSDW